MIKKYKHISFDLDGTLVHTLPEYRYRVIPAVIEAIGGKVPKKRDIDRFWFENARDEIICNDFGVEPAAFWEHFRVMDDPAERSLHTDAYPDSEKAIREIKKRGKKISIITNAPHNIAEFEIKKLNGIPLDYYLSIYDKGFKGKPSPEAFHFVLGELGVKPRETIYIGNSHEDGYFAKNAGVDFIYLERRQHEFDSKDWVARTIHSLEELFA
jgi:HAD superfamily hydrolase (TIGR01549 family)